MKAEDIITRMEAMRNEAQREVLMGFFKTQPGEYGEGDEFLGLKVPQTRKIVKEVKELLTTKFVMCGLYVDENTIDLPEEEWLTDDNGRVLKTLGRRNLYYEKSMYNMNAQPYYVIIDPDGKVLTKENYKYDRDVQKFIAYLNEGLNNYK